MEMQQIKIHEFTRNPIRTLLSLKDEGLEITENGRPIFYLMTVTAFTQIEELFFNLEVEDRIKERIQDGKIPTRVDLNDL